MVLLDGMLFGVKFFWSWHHQARCRGDVTPSMGDAVTAAQNMMVNDNYVFCVRET
jgi:hypothetical protein